LIRKIFLLSRTFSSFLKHLPEEKIKSIIAFVLVSGMLFLNSCDAPRENPLDPNSPDNQLGTIDGNVQTFSLPYTPIKNVEVFWNPGDRLVYSDTSGNFTIPNIKTENGSLIFRKAGFHTDTVQIDWAGTRKVNKQVNLNQIPLLDSLFIYTEVINTISPISKMNSLVIQTKIIDVDNDIDTVFVLNDQQGLIKAMDFNVASKYFQAVLTPEELNISDIEQSVGLEFDFRIRDVLGDIYFLQGGKVTRIIKDQVTGLQPANDQVVTSMPFNLTWNSFIAGYPFHYMVEIYTDDGSLLVKRGRDISAQTTTFAVDSIDSGSYYWVIWVIDDFNNKDRSLPASFSVQ